MLSLIGSLVGGVKQTLRGLFFSPGFPRVMFAALLSPASNSDIFGGENMVRSGEGVISRLRFVNLQTLDVAGGESMSIDIGYETESGSVGSILTAPFLLGAGAAADSPELTGAGGVYDFTALLNPTYRTLPATALVEYTSVYTAGGGTPNMDHSEVYLDYYGDEQP